MPANPERRAHLADAGLRVLAQHGARGLTHRAVDREANVPPGTTANYFRRRSALLGALGDRIFERLAPPPEVFERVGTVEPTLDQAVAYVEAIIERTTRSPELTLALFELRLEAARYPELRHILSAMLERNYASDVAFYQQARLPGGTVEVALLHYAVDGLLLDVLTASINGRENIRQSADQLVRRLLNSASGNLP
ncbi:TetR/AcrR family transcriptional regulator [Deinococcus oregonensis]|uniref:TetR/AcrR family transcriptional regulator n=1 Tax=Deinococcus oregonensis TaxID=1805970 RepID=A0ABV6AVD8_9DEIO